MTDRMTLPRLGEMARQGERIVMHTAYNAWQMDLVEQAGADLVLVGDSVGMVEHGLDSTVPVTLDMMVLHCAAVTRRRRRALVVGDLPFLSYEVDPKEAVRNAGRLVKEARVDAVKLEGGRNRRDTIAALVDAGIPVVGHVGLTPQTAVQLGGLKVQGRDVAQARRILEDAEAVQDGGACLVVLECVPAPLAALITERLHIPTIGIGAGEGCSGQVLVFHDILGIFEDFTPRFVRRYLEGRSLLGEALSRYTQEVRSGAFPGKEHRFSLDPEVLRELSS